MKTMLFMLLIANDSFLAPRG